MVAARARAYTDQKRTGKRKKKEKLPENKEEKKKKKTTTWQQVLQVLVLGCASDDVCVGSN
jgi:hypothetical protein